MATSLLGPHEVERDRETDRGGRGTGRGEGRQREKGGGGGRDKGRDREGSGVFSHKGPNLTMGSPMTSSQLDHLQRPQFQIPSPWGLGLQHVNGGRGTQAFSP